ncbi:tyrosine-type recombinase/integrase [Caballeronia sp. SEWSISQ10-4 2]|uniref:tyrosine-type recombinase/integrase n=1 Tax=Caballeronia sp. SEWSISQ10-4 2 TaxID=2937438 RepID=UPI0026538244|nr:tyrosine-type recombinase/integrase [Caballeronia sp. SEWSISQ10-4 2]MDN7184672.1 tyrosine-type recombinase/integrase [Caballeronia sp. SEWSISQ10-4 2]
MPFPEPLPISAGALLSPKPLEQLSLPSELDGGLGTNRVLGARSQIAAQDDVDAIRAWLARFVDTKATFDTYRKEAERLLLWSTTELRKPLSSLTHEDLLLYRRFLADPRPAQRWVMTGRKVARADAHWRPFAGPLSPASERQAFVILNTLFAWLVNAGYLAGNPLSLSRQRARKAKPRVTRFLEDDLWQAVKTSIDAMPCDAAREQEHYARVRWLISLLYLMGLRISEVVSNPMGGFFRRRDRDGQDRWWLAITGKGDKERLLPATTELMAELTRYRRHYGLAALPYGGETTPLLLPIGGTHRTLTRGAVHLIIKQVFDNAIDHLQSTGEAHERAAERLRQASAHWLRHTAGSHMMDGQVDLRYVRDNLGHASISTTSQYLHADDDDRHRATEAGLRLNW